MTIEGLGTVRVVFAGKKGWTETPDGRVIEKKERELANKKVDADFLAYLNFKKNYPKINQTNILLPLLIVIFVIYLHY